MTGRIRRGEVIQIMEPHTFGSCLAIIDTPKAHGLCRAFVTGPNLSNGFIANRNKGFFLRLDRSEYHRLGVSAIELPEDMQL